MRKRLISLAAVSTLLVLSAQTVFADIAGPDPVSSAGGVVSILLLVAVLAVAAVLIIRRIRRGR